MCSGISISNIFTILCILLSSLGLIGMVTHGAEANTKEIAIRKVYGIDTSEMMVSLNRNIIKLFLPGTFIGSLAAWLIMRVCLAHLLYLWLPCFLSAFRPGRLPGNHLQSLSFKFVKEYYLCTPVQGLVFILLAYPPFYLNLINLSKDSIPQIFNVLEILNEKIF